MFDMADFLAILGAVCVVIFAIFLGIHGLSHVPVEIPVAQIDFLDAEDRVIGSIEMCGDVTFTDVAIEYKGCGTETRHKYIDGNYRFTRMD